MIDLSAPIIPGVSAAGFHIGQFVERNWSGMGIAYVREPLHSIVDRSSDGVRYHSESVELWAANSVIEQIGVHDAYHGKLLGQITLGMTIEDIERRIGPCMDDGEDNLAIAGVEGLAFEVAWRPNHPAKEPDLRLPELPFAPITRFFVCQSQIFVRYRLRTVHQTT